MDPETGSALTDPVWHTYCTRVTQTDPQPAVTTAHPRELKCYELYPTPILATHHCDPNRPSAQTQMNKVLALFGFQLLGCFLGSFRIPFLLVGLGFGLVCDLSFGLVQGFGLFGS